jgi:hypothetical protein
MTEKPPPALVRRLKKQEEKPAFLGQLTNQALADKTPENGGTEDKKKSREMRKYRSLWRVSSQNHYI